MQGYKRKGGALFALLGTKAMSDVSCRRWQAPVAALLALELWAGGWINGVTHGWQGHGGMSYQMSHTWILPE